MQRGSRPGGTVEVIFSPTIFVVETEPRHEQATARRMLLPLHKRQVLLLKSSGLMMFDLIGSIVPLGRRYFPHDSRHFVPGYDRAVPPGKKPFAHRSASQLPNA